MRIAILVNILLSLSCWARAQQDSSGVYLSIADFQRGKLAYAINCNTQKHKIKLSGFLDKPYITVVHEGRRYEHQKTDIFGFRDCQGVDYRFVNDVDCRVLNRDESIVLYSLIQGMDSKTSRKTVSYFFSVGLAGNVLALTLDNLKKAFPDNHKFHDMLDTEFASGAVALTAYDSYHKMYKVCRVYLNSLK